MTECRPGTTTELSPRTGSCRQRPPRIGSGLALAALLAALTACEGTKAKESAAPAAPPPPTVLVADVVRKTVPIVSEFVAQTDAVQTVEIRARVEGVLEQVLFKEGAEVKEGEVLFGIQRAEYEAALQRARAQLAKAEADLTRAQETVEVLRARADLARAQSDLTRAQENVEVLRARAEVAKVRSDLTRAEDRVTVLRAQANVEQKQASLVKAQQDVARFRPLVEAQAIPRQDLDNALAAQDVAKADLDAARAALKDAELGYRVGIEVEKANLAAAEGKLKDTELAYRVGLETARANVTAAEAKLKDTELAQRVDTQQGRANVEAGKAAVSQAELNLSYTQIRAPVTGVIGRLRVDRGNLVGKGESTLLATMSTIDPMKVSLTLSELEYLRFAKRIGERSAAGATPPAAGSERELELILADGTVHPHRGHVVTVERALDTKTGTIVLEARFPNPEKVLRPGQFGRVRAVVEERQEAVLIPQRAVQEAQGQKSVLVVDQAGKVALKTVALAERVGDLVIVTRGVEPGERVIVEGSQKVRPGMQVKPEAAPPRPASAAPPAAAPGPSAAPAPASTPAPAAKPSGG
jgi:membrane fusion protein (multidrug efflux system)